jgi:hypothetical protein
VILRAIVSAPHPEFVIQQLPMKPPHKPNYFPHQSNDIFVSHNLQIAADLAFPDRFMASIPRMGPLGPNLIVTEQVTAGPDGLTRIPIYISPYAHEFIDACIGEA